MTRRLIIAGAQLPLENLSPAMDRAFDRLYGALLSSGTYRWDSFCEQAFKFLSDPGTGPHEHGLFFNNFTPSWNHHRRSARWAQAEAVWEDSVAMALQWETQTGQRVHKGTPYYFWGMTAILRGDLDRGYSLIHKALEDDIHFSGTPQPDLPALALATLNADKLDQAFRPWVLAKAEILITQLTDYCAAYSRVLTFSDVNSRFLQKASVIYPVFILAYVLGRLRKMNEAPQSVFDGQFASQLHLNLLFDLALVVDGAIAIHNTPQAGGSKSFLDHAEALATKSGLQVTRQELRQANKAANQNVEQALSKLLDGIFQASPTNTLGGKERDLAVTYVVRNQGGHGVGPIPVVQSRANEVYRSVFRTLFWVIETFYPQATA